jgi:hypothetical protein
MVKSKGFDDPLKDPLRLFDAKGEPTISQTAWFFKTTSIRLKDKSKTNDHA